MKNRRKVIDCKLIRESKDNPGYFRYDVTIQELSGEVQQYKQQYDAKQNQTGDELINSELKLYAIDTEGEWG